MRRPTVISSLRLYRQSGLVPRRDLLQPSSLRRTVMDALQGTAAAGLVVLCFGLAGWLDDYSARQHELHAERQKVALARAYAEGRQRGQAETMQTAQTAWAVANDERTYRCGGR